ncbi:MAG TPA: methyltransferase domain-containing protein [Vicinamibacterales bacterium]|nr:methyltransferase domain-containing protein [Vicinamibacterales bacterium]
MICPGCSSPESTTKYRMASYRVVICRSCGMMYNGDFPHPKDVGATFDENYYRNVQAEAFAHVGGAGHDASRPIYEMGMAVVEKRAGKGRVLDVGCAFGSFIELAKSRGWTASGVEVSPYSSKFARESRGLDVFTGDLADYTAAAESFDLVTLWDVIEHVREAQGTLTRAARLLKPGGHLMLTTDNYRSLLSMLAAVSYYGTFGRLTYAVERFFIPFNSCYLTHADVSRMAGRTGFREVFFTGIDYPIEKIKLSAAERLLLGTLYGVGAALKLNSQFLIVVQKA